MCYHRSLNWTGGEEVPSRGPLTPHTRGPAWTTAREKYSRRRAALSVAMRCHFTSTHFHLLRVLAGQTERSAAREAIYIRGARLCLWTAHPDPAQRHRAHASRIERSAWHFQTSGGGVGSRQQLSQSHPPQRGDCPCRPRYRPSCRPRTRGDPCALEAGPPEGAPAQ